MAFKYFTSSGSLDIFTVSDRLGKSRPTDVIGMKSTVTGNIETTAVFPNDFYNIPYLGGNDVINYAHTTSNYNINITAFGAYTLVSNSAWLTIQSGASGIGNGTFSVTINLSANGSNNNRQGGFTLTHTGTGENVGILIEQDGKPVSYAPVTLSFVGTDAQNACVRFDNAETQTLYINDTQTFATATTLKSQSDGGGLPINAGYFSNGTISRYWTGSSFTTTDNCNAA